MRREGRTHPARFETREIQERVHQLEQAQGIVVRQLEARPLPAAERLRGIAETVLERPQHQRERRAELVADVAEERRLGAIDFAKGLRALVLRLVRAGVGDDVRNLVRGHREERAVALVEHAVRAQSGDEQREWLRVAGGGEGQHDGPFGPRLPAANRNAAESRGRDRRRRRPGWTR